MNNSQDDDFLREYKPLHVPHDYWREASTQDNVVYALALLKEGTAKEVAAELSTLDPQTDFAIHLKNAEDVLGYLFDKGLIKAIDRNGEIKYNLSKIETPNSGKVD